MERAIAICRGGPLDGQCFSVLLDEQGSPAPMHSRVEPLGGILYSPVDEVAVEEEHQAQFRTLTGRIEPDGTFTVSVDHEIPHDTAFEYSPAEVDLVAWRAEQGYPDPGEETAEKTTP